MTDIGLYKIETKIKIRPVIVRREGTIFLCRGVIFRCFEDGRCIRLDNGCDVSTNVPDDDGHIRIRVRGKDVYLNRLLFSALRRNIMNEPKTEIDHEDRNPANNAISNLREATRSENADNRGLFSNNTSGQSCIRTTYDKRRDTWSWRVRVRHLGKPHSKYFLGGRGHPPDDVYDHIPDEVIAMRDHMKRTLHGEFACL